MPPARRTRSKQKLNESFKNSLGESVKELEERVKDLSLTYAWRDQLSDTSEDENSTPQGRYYKDPVYRPNTRVKLREDIENIEKMGVWSPAPFKLHKFKRKGRANIINTKARSAIDESNIIDSKLRIRLNSSIKSYWIPKSYFRDDDEDGIKPRTRQRRKRKTIFVISKEADFPLKSILKTNKPCKTKRNEPNYPKKVTFSSLSSLLALSSSNSEDNVVESHINGAKRQIDCSVRNVGNSLSGRMRKKLTLSAADVTDLMLELH